MKKIKFESTFLQSPITELDPQDRQLLELALESAKNAYAPYSGFHVGAALLLEDGTISTGNNQENAAYPTGLCAERVAVFHAGAVHPGIPVKTIAIRAISDNKPVNKPVAPCGSCRQALAEYEYRFGKPIRILMMGETGDVLQADSVASLLPVMFTGSTE